MAVMQRSGRGHVGSMRSLYFCFEESSMESSDELGGQRCNP